MIRSQKVALRLAVKALGARAFVKDYGKESSAEKRGYARSEMAKLARLPSPDITNEEEWPESATVGEFREALRKHAVEAAKRKKAHDELFATAMYYRYAVGVMRTGYGSIQGTGDTWDEALKKAGVNI